MLGLRRVQKNGPNFWNPMWVMRINSLLGCSLISAALVFSGEQNLGFGVPKGLTYS